MTLITDVSVTLSWCFPDEEENRKADEAIDMLIKNCGLVPSIWWYEVRNAFLMGERRGRISPEETVAFLKKLKQFPIEIDKSPPLDSSLTIAREHSLTVYNASYLELVLRENFPFNTLDKKLLASARALSIQII